VDIFLRLGFHDDLLRSWSNELWQSFKNHSNRFHIAHTDIVSLRKERNRKTFANIDFHRKIRSVRHTLVQLIVSVSMYYNFTCQTTILQSTHVLMYWCLYCCIYHCIIILPIKFHTFINSIYFIILPVKLPFYSLLMYWCTDDVLLYTNL